MKTFNFEIKETLQRNAIIRAENEQEARIKIKELYHNEDIVLDSGDYSDTEFNLID